jgi:hypothetical protein
MKEGTFTIAAGQPLYVHDTMLKGWGLSSPSRPMCEYTVTVDVTGGDAVLIQTTTDNAKNPMPKGSVKQGLTTSVPTKKIVLADRLDCWDDGETLVRFFITTTGASSDVKVRITAQDKFYNKKTGQVE